MRLITSLLVLAVVAPLAHAQNGPAEIRKAIQAHSEAIKKNPKDADALFGRAVAYEAIGRDLLAVQDLSAFIKVNPKSAPGYERRATAYFRTGEFARAQSDYSAAVFLDPTNAAALFGLGMTHRMDRFNTSDSGERHIASALALQRDIDVRMAERGVK